MTSLKTFNYLNLFSRLFLLNKLLTNRTKLLILSSRNWKKNWERNQQQKIKHPLLTSYLNYLLNNNLLLYSSCTYFVVQQHENIFSVNCNSLFLLFSRRLFFTVKLFIRSFQYYNCNYKEKTSNILSALYSLGSCTLAKLLLLSSR